jgi:N-acetylmuramoyl-L-alanine amidase
VLSELWTEIWEIAILALVVWREARGEGELGMRAVAWSIRNRVEHPAWWGTDYGSVIAKREQYSSMTHAGDQQLSRFPAGDDASFAQALEIAYALIHDEPMVNPVPTADSFYDTSISAPNWATPDCYVGTVGRIRFYNVDHDFEVQVVRFPLSPTVAELPAKPPEKNWWQKLWG